MLRERISSAPRILVGAEVLLEAPARATFAQVSGDAELLSFVRMVASGSETDALRRLAAAPGLALPRVEVGATRAAVQEYSLAEIGHPPAPRGEGRAAGDPAPPGARAGLS